MTSEDYGPWYKGDTGQSLKIQFMLGEEPEALDGATSDDFALIMTRPDGTEKKLGAGDFTITQASEGRVEYAPDAADVDTTGEWQLWFVRLYSSKPVHAHPKTIMIEDAPGLT